MKGLAPDWNNILVCDNGKGYTPSPINAPSLSYTGVPDEESKYDYEWQMKSGNGEWKSFQSAKGVEFIPSGRVPVLTNAAGSTELTYSFRLKVDDKTYHLQAETEEYTIRIASAPAPYYDIVNNANGILIDLQVKGGGGVKKFAWASADGRNNIPSSQSKVEDPSGLKPGSYKVTISDAVCNPIVHLINTDEKNRKHP
ncbi:MAG TPA: hypothetical protein PLP34_04225 [Chitinophagaceae bacterium]|nr:hypothetical protein [Chitinophagaceae bacterium]HNF71595.1 hypothetical protein [Chitinophagaceae bacterium]